MVAIVSFNFFAWSKRKCTLTMNRLIVTLLVCPIRWIRITACSSTAGFHHGSYNRCKILVHQNYIPRLLNRNMLSMEIEWQKVKKRHRCVPWPLHKHTTKNIQALIPQAIYNFSTWEDNIPNKFSTKFLEMKWVLFLNPSHPNKKNSNLSKQKSLLQWFQIQIHYISKKIDTLS